MVIASLVLGTLTGTAIGGLWTLMRHRKLSAEKRDAEADLTDCERELQTVIEGRGTLATRSRALTLPRRAPPQGN